MKRIEGSEPAPFLPEGHEAAESHETPIEDQLSAIVDHLGRVSMIEDKQLQQEAVNHAAEVLDADNLQEIVVDEVTGEETVVTHFGMVDILPELHKLDEEVTEEKILEFATEESLLHNQDFTNQLVENVAEIIAEEPLIRVPKFKAEAIRGEAQTKIYEIRSEAYENGTVDESNQQD